MRFLLNDEKDIDYSFALESPIQLPVAEMRSIFTDIDGRDGSVHEDLGLQDVNLSATFNLIRFTDVYNDVSRFVAALYFADRYSADHWPFYFRKKHLAWQAINNDMGITAKVTITARCDPFKYLKDDQTQTFAAPGSIVNKGTYFSKPLIKVYAKGNGVSSITINGTRFTLNMQKDYVFVDCDLMDAYYTDTNMNRFMDGEFPVLNSGTNDVTFDGAISKIDIDPRCRSL